MAFKLFGTDGIRGPINSHPLLPDDLTRLGGILGYLVKNRACYPSLVSATRPLITIGRDTRSSGVYIESALVAGVISAGVDCELVGIMPTSAIASAAKKAKACFGVVISASHNPYLDNGIKIFGPDGFKITEELEQIITAEFFQSNIFSKAIAESPGQIIVNQQAEKDHMAMLKSLISLKRRPLRIVLDCAHGAAAHMAPEIFSELSSEIRLIGCAPNGSNINRGFGSEAPERLQREVLDFKADIGIAFDGDADRVIFVDERAQIVDGDAILAALALHLHRHNKLNKNTIVATIMSSVALDNALAPHGISVVRTAVGDKYVARHMLEGGYSFGGENSGHLIMFPVATTGDGIFSALNILEIIFASELPLSHITSFYQPTPRVLRNIEVAQKTPLVELPLTQAALDQANHNLQNWGRVLLRYSGTENKARLLVEAQTTHECQRIADDLTALFCSEISAKLKSNLY